MKFRNFTLKPNNSVLSFAFVFLTTLFSFIQAQTVHVVDNNEGSGAGFTSLQAAIDAATAGDIIYLQPSPNSYGDITMNKTLSIYGLGHKPEVTNEQSARLNNVNFNGSASASGSKLSGLQIEGIYLDYSGNPKNNIVITDNRIRFIRGSNATNLANNAIISGNFFYTNISRAIDNNNSQNWIITHNTFTMQSDYFGYDLFFNFNGSTIFKNNIILSRQNGNGNQSIQIFNQCNNTLIENNIFLFTGTNVANMNLGGNGNLSFNNNLTYSYNSTLDALTGNNNIDNTDPQFVSFNPNSNLNTPTQNYQFQDLSPAESAGTDGKDLGVWNLDYPYSLRGYPDDLPHITAFTIFNTSVTAGSTLNINIKAQKSNILN